MSFYGDLWEKWVLRFWWLRGAVAAITLAALVPKFTDLTQFQTLRAFHVLIVGWNALAAWIGSLIGRLPFVPDIPSVLILAIVFGFSFGIPVGLALRRILASELLAKALELGDLDQAAKITSDRSKRLPIGGFAGYMMLVLPFSAMYAGLWSIYWVVMPWYYTLPLLVFCGYLLITLTLAVNSIVRHVYPNYFKGMIFGLAFIVTLEALYLLRAPWLTEWVNTTACEQLQDCGDPAPATSKPAT